MGNERRLYSLDLFSLHTVYGELRPKLVEVLKALFTPDEIGIGNRIGGAREEIGQAHLIAHIRRQYREGQVKRPGNLLENAAQQFVFCGVDRRGNLLI